MAVTFTKRLFSLKESLEFQILGQARPTFSEKLGSEDSFRELTKKYSNNAHMRSTIPGRVRCVDFNAELEIEEKMERYELRIRCEDQTIFPAPLQTFSEVLLTLT